MTRDRSWIDAGETLLWSDRPAKWQFAMRMGRSTFLFGILFFGFSIYWTVSELGESSGSFGLLGVLFVIIGGGMLLSPVWYFMQGTHTTYGLTDRRAVVDTAGHFPNRLSVPLTQIQFVEMKPFPDGTGDIYFKESAPGDNDNWRPSRDGFIAIADAGRVERLLRNALERR